MSILSRIKAFFAKPASDDLAPDLPESPREQIPPVIDWASLIKETPRAPEKPSAKAPHARSRKQPQARQKDGGARKGR